MSPDDYAGWSVSSENQPDEPVGDDAIRAVVTRLARPHPDGKVIERAAILAEGDRSGAIVEWITAHAGRPEAAISTRPSRGLHGARDDAVHAPLRYVLPADALA